MTRLIPVIARRNAKALGPLLRASALLRDRARVLPAAGLHASSYVGMSRTSGTAIGIDAARQLRKPDARETLRLHVGAAGDGAIAERQARASVRPGVRAPRSGAQSCARHRGPGSRLPG